jgi:hypothetical protein
MYIKDIETGEILGRVITNRSLTFDEAMELAGFEWIERDNESGWSQDGGLTFYDESTAEMVDEA